MTKSSGPPRAGIAAAGSGVASNLRFAEYSASLSFAMPDSKKLLAGASGYSFKEWKGTFYPADMKPDGMLRFYGERLPTVEINNTFYRMPKVEMLENWARTTPDSFRFAIKASRRITHFAHLKAATAERKVILAGRTLEPGDKTFGLVIFEAADESAARKFMNRDPAVAEKIMTAELHPYAVALQRKPPPASGDKQQAVGDKL